VPKLIVFDLDDTLADTAGTILARAEREAVEALVAQGLRTTPEEASIALREIRDRDCAAPFLPLLVERFGAPDPAACVAAGRRAFFGNDARGIRPVPGATETLAALAARGIGLALLTFGVRATQERKIAELGLDRFFSRVRIIDLALGSDKTIALAEMIREAGLTPVETWVVGDRPPGEIRAGRELGAFTVRLRRGEFASLDPAGPEEEADRTIDTLPALLDMLCWQPVAEGPPRA
jgi:FMN phosphatase YigB (HAD superfamily)